MIGSQEHPIYSSDTQLASESYSVTILGLIFSVLVKPSETRRLWARLVHEEKEPGKVFWLESWVMVSSWRSWRVQTYKN